MVDEARRTFQPAFAMPRAKPCAVLSLHEMHERRGGTERRLDDATLTDGSELVQLQMVGSRAAQDYGRHAFILNILAVQKICRFLPRPDRPAAPTSPGGTSWSRPQPVPRAVHAPTDRPASRRANPESDEARLS